MRSSIRPLRAGIVAGLAALLVVGVAAPSSAGDHPGQELFGGSSSTAPAALPPGFSDTEVFNGLTQPTVLQFAPDGRVFVGEKAGTVKVFDSLTDPSPTTVKNLSSEVYDSPDSDRGLLGMALDPAFGAGNPYVYVLYTLDAPIGETPPVFHDSCPDPVGAGCTVGARLARFQVFANNTSGPEQILLEDWCQQFPSHSIGTLAFGPDGALYVGGGDGASYVYADWGQTGNPCGDPVNEGGALRSQDQRTQTDPTGMNGSILRVDPATGNALPDNPLIGGDATDDRIIAFGMRNPYRFVVRPGTDRIYVGEVGWNAWEEIDRINSAGDAKVENFGWPCLEGIGKQPDYRAAHLPLCKSLYSQGTVIKPMLQISHDPGGCDGSSVLSGIAFYPGGSYPAQYSGALFVTDIRRGCLWTLLPKPSGDPDPTTFSTFGTDIRAVDIKPGPGGDLFYVDLDGGKIHRIVFS